MDQIEQLICQRVDENKDKIIAFGRDLWHHAELGFQEFRTAGKFAQGLKELGLETEEGLAITGVKGYLKGKGAPGITVALMGEFDGLPIPNCKYAGSRNKPISYIQHTSFQDENYVAECP